MRKFKLLTKEGYPEKEMIVGKIYDENHKPVNGIYVRIKELVSEHPNDWEEVFEIDKEVFESPWISVNDRLPENYKFNLSKDVLTISGNKMSVKRYDHDLYIWSGSKYMTVTHWMPLPEAP